MLESNDVGLRTLLSKQVGIEADGMFQQKTDNSQLGWNFNIKRCLDENIRGTERFLVTDWSAFY